MTFGEALKEARQSRGWSRYVMCVMIKQELAKDAVKVISEDTIKDLELGITQHPRGTTVGVICRLIPELREYLEIIPLKAPISTESRYSISV